MLTSSPSAVGTFTSPLGPVHLASPEDQGLALKAVLKLFRRKRPAPAAAEEPVVPVPTGSAFPRSSAARRAGLECKLERSTSFTVTYEPCPLPTLLAEEAAATEQRRRSPPPAYKVLGCATTLEEDILITEAGDVFIKAHTPSRPCSESKKSHDDQLPIQVETPAERKDREKHERLEQKRRTLLEQDRLLGEALGRLGM